MKHFKEIEYLNMLVRLNHDRIACYEHVAHLLHHASSLDAAPFFAQFIPECQRNINNLSAEVKRLGGRPANGPTLTGKILLLWIELRMSVSADRVRVIMDGCERLHKLIFRAYDHVIGSSAAIPAAVRQELLDQKIALDAACNLVNTYRGLQQTYFASQQQ